MFLGALHKQRCGGNVDAAAVLDAYKNRLEGALDWPTAAHALIITGDDGSQAMSLLESVYANHAVSQDTNCLENVLSCSVAVAYAVVRAPSTTLSDRLSRLRHILSALPASEVCTTHGRRTEIWQQVHGAVIIYALPTLKTEVFVQMDQFALREKLSHAAIAGFFQHSNAMFDLSQHGLVLLLSELLAAGLPFTGHLQKCLARHMHVLSAALVRHRVHDASGLELKFGVGRLAVGDVHFAGSLAGRRCISRAAAAQGRTATTVSARSTADNTPYCCDGRFASTGFAIFPTAAESVVSDCQEAAAGWLPPAGGDLGALCRQMQYDTSPNPVTAEFLLSGYASRFSSVDWASTAEDRPSRPGIGLLLPSGEERYLQQAMELPPEHLAQALHAVRTAFRLIQAVPPE